MSHESHRFVTNLGAVFQTSIELLNDGSWEILVQIADIPLLRAILSSICPNSILDEQYRPFNPSQQDVDYFGRKRAEEICALWFQERVNQGI